MPHSVRRLIGPIAATIAAAVIGPGTTLASPPILAAAVKAGIPAKDCQYCHTEASPKTDQRNLKTVDVEKLKELGKK